MRILTACVFCLVATSFPKSQTQVSSKVEQSVQWEFFYFCCYQGNMVPSPHIVATYVVIHTHTYCTFHHVDTEIHVLIPRPASSRTNSCMTCCFLLLHFFVFVLFSCDAHVNISFLYRFGLSCWVAWDLSFLFCFPFALVWGQSEVSGAFYFLLCFVLLCFYSFLRCRPSSSAVHPPSKDLATPPVFASSCAAWTFGGWKFQSSPHQVCVYFSVLP